MNKNDRKELKRGIGALESAMEIIDSLADQEREKFDNLPEGLQEAESGQSISMSADALENCKALLDEARDFAGEAMDC